MIKKIQLLLIFSFQILFINGQISNTILSNIYNDTVWSSDTLKIYNDITIDDSATLTILDGTYIEFQGNFSIIVSGRIKALGSLNDSVKFTINDTTAFNDTTTIDGGWRGIRFLPNERNDTSFFSYCSFEYGKAVKPGLTGNMFISEENMGGCIYAYEYPNIKIINSSFINNRSNCKGGAIHIEESNYVEITECYFERNMTFMKGGGISIKNVWYFIISNNIFYENTAFMTINNIGQTGSGSGVYVTLGVTNGIGYVKSNKFFNNKSVNGAFYENCLRIRVLNNIVANNEGVGMAQAIGYTYNSLYANNTIVNNWGSTVPALWVNSVQSKMINNIIWGNGSDPSFGYQIWNGSGNTANIDYSCIENGYEGDGILDTYPEFVNPTDGYGLEFDALYADWSLIDDSPCINTGITDTSGYNLPSVDLEGNTRIFGNRVDMGAYENQNVWVKINNFPESEMIRLYPTPASKRITINIPHQQNIHIELTNTNGQLVLISNPDENTISLEGIIPGLYIATIKQDNIILAREKLIVR